MTPGPFIAILDGANQPGSEQMNEEQRALLIPSKVLFELWYATVFHLSSEMELIP